MDCPDILSINGQSAAFTEVLRSQNDQPTTFLQSLCLDEINITLDLLGISVQVDALYHCLEDRKARDYGITLLKIEQDCEILVSDLNKFRRRMREVVDSVEEDAENKGEEDDEDGGRR